MGSTGNPNSWGTYDSYRDSSSSDFSPLLIALIGILASAFILISYYTLISKYCNRRRNGDITRDRGISSSASDHWQGTNGATNSNPVIGQGLDESWIKSITVYKFKKRDGFVDSSDYSVCLSEFQENESLRLLPKCNHTFQVPCIDTWLQSHSNCPLCRTFIARINVTTAIEIVPVTNQSTSIHQIDTESTENNASSTDHHHQHRDSVVVSSDLESRLQNETVININTGSTPKPPELQESRDEQVNRISASVNSGTVVSIADILRRRRISRSRNFTAARRRRRRENASAVRNSGESKKWNFEFSSSELAAMKNSVSTMKFVLSNYDRAKNYRLPN